VAILSALRSTIAQLKPLTAQLKNRRRIDALKKSLQNREHFVG
jgi:hypothetical protein